MMNIPAGAYIMPDEQAKIDFVNSLEYDHPTDDVLLKYAIEAPEIPLRVKPNKITADCIDLYHATKSSGLRPLSVIDLHIIHCTQAGIALGTARYFASAAAGGSTQYVSDNRECFRCLRDNQIPWGAPGANYRGLHYEQAGWASWTTVMWSHDHQLTMRRTAFKIARDCRRYGNPPVWLGPKALEAGHKGITDHATCTKVFGGTHTDPGGPYPRKLLMMYVRYYYFHVHVRRVA